MPTVFSRTHIRVLAPVLFALPVIAVGLLLTGSWRNQSRKAIAELAGRNTDQIHDLAEAKIAAVLNAPQRLCRINKHLVESGALNPDQVASWKSTFFNESRAFEQLSAITWGAVDGRCVWVSRYVDGSVYWAIKEDPTQDLMYEWRIDEEGDLVDATKNGFEFDLFSRPWFQTAREAGIAAWSDPYVWAGGVESEEETLGLSYGVPVYSAHGNFLGVVDADYSLNDLSRYLETLQIGKTGVAFLATRDAKLLAVSNEAPIVDSTGERIEANAIRGSRPLQISFLSPLTCRRRTFKST